ncbi:hypothetical protein ISD62_18685 [Pseudomonas aeruginosa]|nr:hypothetical protein [Pseudomonas aeruginosa]
MARKVEKARRLEVSAGSAELVCVPSDNFDFNVKACADAVAAFKRIDPTLAFKDWEEGTTGYSIERALADAARRCRVVTEREGETSSRRAARLKVFRPGQDDLECVKASDYDKVVKACAAAAKILARLDPDLNFRDWQDGSGRIIEKVLAPAARKCKAVADAEAL